MTIQMLSLVSHPTVITVSDSAAGSFEGWGVRIGG
jgi:hypothetical protein